VETDGSYGRFTLADPAIELYVVTVRSDELETSVKAAPASIGWLRGQDDVRTFLEDIEEEVQIPAYSAPA